MLLNKNEVDLLAKGNGWGCVAEHPSQYMVSYSRNDTRLNIYLSKGTVVISADKEQISRKKVSDQELKDIFRTAGITNKQKLKAKKEKKKEVDNGLVWADGRPKEPGYFCINRSLKKYYFDGKVWNVPVMKNGKFIRRALEVVPIIKCCSKIENV